MSPAPTTPTRLISAMRLDPMPIDGARHDRVRAQRAAQDALGLARRADEGIEVDPGVHVHLVQHRDEVLGGDVARRAGGDGAAAELAEARLEALAAGLERGEDVGESLAAGVVEVRGELDVAAERLARRREELADLARVGHPGRVAEADLLRAGGDQAPGDVEDA